MPQRYLAHSANEAGKVQLLRDHLENVAKEAGKFAEAFGGTEEAHAAGLLHDAGKFRAEWQSYLRNERGRGLDTHHAAYGAALAFRRTWPCSFAIAGHHAGLHDVHQLQELVDDEGPYEMADRLPVLERLFRQAVGDIPEHVRMPEFLAKESPLILEFYIRMLFSCLVDADYLDTEEHTQGKPRSTTKLPEVCPVLLDRILEERNSKTTEGTVNQIRHGIFDQCLRKASHEQGFFSLTVPTGGGKTLSGMAFALAHAEKWKLDRVIVVIPYLSIIEQNASEYRRILDPDSHDFVVEHHSAVMRSGQNGDDEPSPMEQATENWDAPVIVTTTVQFIETLFASSPSKCRKLHNISRSVVILDEVQTLPSHLLDPLLNVLKELRKNYGVTFLFMTATQPAFRHSGTWLPEGFEPGEVTEITEDTGRVFHVLKRVNYKIETVLDWPTIAQRMACTPQALAVVNVRKHAFVLWEALWDNVFDEERDSVFHLSSAMCAQHRLFTLGKIKDPREGSIRHRLNSGLPCRVVSTQVVEAGVDLDFPLVFRAMGPLDSIVQAAGRCNREGRLVDSDNRPIPGEVVVFTPQEPKLPLGVYKTATEHTASFLNRVSTDSLGTEPEIFGDYFSQLFQQISTDYSRGREAPIQEDRAELRFRRVSRKAKVIQDGGTPVVVPYGKGKGLIDDIRSRAQGPGAPRFGYRDLRKLQRFLVNVREKDFQQLEDLGMVSRLLPDLDLFLLEEGCYSNDLGLLINQRPMEDFIQ